MNYYSESSNLIPSITINLDKIRNFAGPMINVTRYFILLNSQYSESLLIGEYILVINPILRVPCFSPSTDKNQMNCNVDMMCA